MTRLEANLLILEELEMYFRANPDIRFGQALRNTGTVLERQTDDGIVWANEFNTESTITLARVRSKG